jgi:hypothetical protein
MAKQSLAAQSGAVAVPFTMPSVFSAPVEPVKARAISPYITFAHPKRSDEWAKLVAKFQHVAESDMFLIEPDNLTSLSNVKCTLFSPTPRGRSSYRRRGRRCRTPTRSTWRRCSWSTWMGA